MPFLKDGLGAGPEAFQPLAGFIQIGDGTGKTGQFPAGGLIGLDLRLKRISGRAEALQIDAGRRKSSP
ncbi:hypothetical protein V6L77_01500 [Pannonibacter sp. Pt2-lr]